MTTRTASDCQSCLWDSAFSIRIRHILEQLQLILFGVIAHVICVMSRRACRHFRNSRLDSINPTINSGERVTDFVDPGPKLFKLLVRGDHLIKLVVRNGVLKHRIHFCLGVIIRLKRLR